MMLTGFVVARVLSVEAFGQFTAAWAFASLVAIVADSGMGMLAARDVAQETSTGYHQLDELYSWRLWMILAGSVVGPLLGLFLLPSPEARRLAIGLVPGALLLGLADLFCWIFKGALRAGWCAVLQIGSRLLLLTLSIVAVMSSQPLTGLALAYIVSGFTMSALGWLVLARKMKVLHWATLGPTFFTLTLPKIYRIGAIMILSVAFSRVDLLIVSAVTPAAQAGLFAAASRLIDAVRLLPMVACSIYLPTFSSLHDKPEELRSCFKSAFTYLLLASVAIALITTFFAEPILGLLLGTHYVPAAGVLRIMIWSAIPLCTNILMFSLLYALHDHRSAITGISTAICIEIVLDLLFVPHLGIKAAAGIRLLADSINGLILARGVFRRMALA